MYILPRLYIVRVPGQSLRTNACVHIHFLSFLLSTSHCLVVEWDVVGGLFCFGSLVAQLTFANVPLYSVKTHPSCLAGSEHISGLLSSSLLDKGAWLLAASQPTMVKKSMNFAHLLVLAIPPLRFFVCPLWLSSHSSLYIHLHSTRLSYVITVSYCYPRNANRPRPVGGGTCTSYCDRVGSARC